MGMPPNSQPGPTVSGPPYMPNPTPADFDKLRGFDAHYTKYVVSDQNNSKDTKKHKTTTTTTLNLTRHICGHCGGLRSKRYHLQHPIVSGEAPIPGFCRRCQRDASSTSSASSTEESRRRKKGNDRYKGKSGGEKKSVRVVDFDRRSSLIGDAQRFESSGSEMESYVQRRKPDHKRVSYLYSLLFLDFLLSFSLDQHLSGCSEAFGKMGFIIREGLEESGIWLFGCSRGFGRVEESGLPLFETF